MLISPQQIAENCEFVQLTHITTIGFHSYRVQQKNTSTNLLMLEHAGGIDKGTHTDRQDVC
jgi:hypothetical protein